MKGTYMSARQPVAMPDRTEDFEIEAKDGRVYFHVPIVDGSDTRTMVHFSPEEAKTIAWHLKNIAVSAGLHE